MAMDRLLKVSSAWNWLPAFRVVAEYQSIQKAAVVLNVSASALSRTVRLLEDAVGEMLFVRSATGLTLTHAGVELLRGTRDAMRRVDDVFAATPGDVVLTFAASASGSVLPRLLARALSSVVAAHRDVAYRVLRIDEQDVFAELLRGNIDLALVEATGDVEVPPDITATLLGSLELAVVAPPTMAVDAPSDERLVRLAHAHAPPGHARAVVDSIDDAELLAAASGSLALLPTALVAPGFRVVGTSSVRVPVHAVSRTPLRTADTSEKHVPLVLAATLAAVAALVP